MSAVEMASPEFCLCGQPHPCPEHSPEGIEAAYRRLGPPPQGCRCKRCAYAVAHPILATTRTERAEAPVARRVRPLPDEARLAQRIVAAPTGPVTAGHAPVVCDTAPDGSLPVAPFLRAAGFSVDLLPDEDRRSLARARVRGFVTDDQVDRWTVLLGLAPEQVWPEYAELWESA